MSRYHKWRPDLGAGLDKWERCTVCFLRKKGTGKKARYHDGGPGWFASTRVPPCEPEEEIKPPGRQRTGQRHKPGQLQKTDAEAQARAAKNRAEVYNLYVYQSMTYRQIEEYTEKRISKTEAHRLLQEYEAELNAQSAETSAVRRAHMAARLDDQRRDVMEMMHVLTCIVEDEERTDDDGPRVDLVTVGDFRLRAHNTLLRIEERFAKLDGLDAPTQILIAEGVKEYTKRMIEMMEEDKPELAGKVAEYFQGRLDE